MKTLDHQAIIDRVYRHFIVNRQPPGVDGACPAYHTAQKRANSAHDSPCAIGLSDTRYRLLDPAVSDIPVEGISDELLCDVFGVDRLTENDRYFLFDLQLAHDQPATRYCSHQDRAPFARELNHNLGIVLYHHAVRTAHDRRPKVYLETQAAVQ